MSARVETKRSGGIAWCSVWTQRSPYRFRTKALGDRGVHVRLEDQPDRQQSKFSAASEMHQAIS